MKNRTLVETAIVLILVGAAGMAIAGAASSMYAGRSATVAPALLGRRIYLTGTDAAGQIPRTIGGAGLIGLGVLDIGSCADCHGLDGRGGRVLLPAGAVVVPDIRYSTLTSAPSVDGTTTAPWTDADIAHAIRDGVTPSGVQLTSPMPRWAMSDTDLSAVIAYLKELS